MKIYISNDDETFSYEMEKEKITVGRYDQCDFHIPREELSRLHCEIYLENEKVSILDTGSKNGVYVDGVKIPAHTKVPVSASSKIKISSKFDLTFTKRPGHTQLGSTGQISLETIPQIPVPKKSIAKTRSKK